MKRSMAIGVTLLGLVGWTSFSFSAELNYPTKNIEMMVGYAPGGGTDLGARIIAEHAKKTLGREIVVINKPGGAGSLAMTLLSKSKADGYTLAAATDTSIIFSPHLEPVKYKPLEDFTFIVQYGVVNNGIVVSADSPYRTLKDLIEFARANPNKVTVSTVGSGSPAQVIVEALLMMENLKAQLIPFSGATPAMTALLGGHVSACSVASSGYSPHMATKKVRLIATMSEERLDEYPGVPTLKELGYSSLVSQSFYIIAGPKNMDVQIVKKLQEAFIKAMDQPDFVKLAKQLEIWTKKPLAGEEMRKALIRRDLVNQDLFKRIGMQMHH